MANVPILENELSLSLYQGPGVDVGPPGVGVGVLVGVSVRVGVGVRVWVGVRVGVTVGPPGVGVLVGVGIGQMMVMVEEKTDQLKVVLAETVLPGGIPGTAPRLSLEETVSGEEAAAFHHQSPVLSQTWTPSPLVQVILTGVVAVAAL